MRAVSAVGGLALLSAAGITTAQAAEAAQASPAARLSAQVAAAAAVPAVATVSAAPAVALAAAPPQGVLAQGAGCTGDVGAAVTCTLTAQATSPITAGGATAQVWSFVGTTGTTTVNNPTIVATAGQQVTINLTNGLPTTLSRAFPVSLAVPGLSDLTSDYQGVDSGSSKAYTFTPSQPGTYLYQAGHILRRNAQGGFDSADVGPREVAMGLAGVLVVRPSDFGTGTAQTEFGAAAQTPANQFDDEAALLLTDVDPAFSAAPDTYDLRNFKGSIRLINGKAYPSTDPIGSAPGHKVLLRYVNAGVVSHSMGVLGQRQSVVGISGHVSTGEGLLADTIDAGNTEDAIVSVPSTGGNGQIAVLDASGRLDTNGATTGARRQLLFGGMLTFIQYTAASLATDTVGPNASAVTASPSPLTAGTDLTVSATFTDPDVTVSSGPPSSAISAAQAAIDSFGGTTYPMTLTSTGATSATGTVTIPAADLAGLSSGGHKVLVRAADSATPPNWGPTGSASFIVNIAGPTVTLASLSPSVTNGVATPATNQNGVVVAATGDDSAVGGTITGMSYAVDGGATVAFPAFPAGATVAPTAVIPWSVINGLGEGTHSVTITATDSANVTSATPATVTLTVDRTGPVSSGAAVSPSPTNVTVGDPVDPTSIKVSGSFSDSSTNLVAAEGFLQPATAQGAPDAARTCGSATFPCQAGTGFVFVATDGAFDSKAETGYGTFPLTQLAGYKDGTFTVWVRAKDAAGNWGQLTSTAVVVDKSAPAVATAVLAQPGAPVLAAPTLTVTATDVGNPPSAITAAEWFEGTDPGVGLATPVALNTPVTVQLASGRFHTVSVRVRDAAGNWSAVKNSNALYVDPIFADTFGNAPFGTNGSGAAWTGGTAGAPTFPLAPAGMNGRFAMLTANNSASSYVTTPVLAGTANPTAATYNAKFLFENNGVAGANPLLTLANGNAVNIASLRLGGTDVVDVQYLRATAAGTATLRLRYRLGTGAYVNSTSVSLGANGAVHTIRVGWAAGTAAALSLQVDAGTPLTLTVNTGNNARVDRTVLGLSTTNGASGFASGRAYFDQFEARRNSMP